MWFSGMVGEVMVERVGDRRAGTCYFRAAEPAVLQNVHFERGYHFKIAKSSRERNETATKIAKIAREAMRQFDRQRPGDSNFRC